MIIKIIYYIIFTVTILYGFYFLLTGVFVFFKSSKLKLKEGKKENYFSILIAARNEEKVIGNLLDSLNNLNYPKDKYEVVVIPNNCTDNTEKVSKEHGAKVLKCTVPTKSKGDVLKFTFEKMAHRKEIDAYIVFDADNVVHPEFLTEMDKALVSGYRVAEGYRDAKNPSDNWLSGSYTLFYLFQNVFFNRARMAMGGSSSINGTGFMIKKELIDEKGFETYTLTEDVEFTGQCALMGEKIAYVENAITYDEYPVRFDASWKQRKRWSAGIIECMKRYSPKLFWTFLKTGRISCLDMSLVYLGPLMQLLGFIDLIMLIIFRIVNFELYDIFSYVFATGWLWVVISYLLGIITELFVLWFKGKKPHKLVSGIIMFIIFIFTWIPINIICFVKKHTKWEEIKHDRNVKINEVVK